MIEINSNELKVIRVHTQSSQFSPLSKMRTLLLCTVAALTLTACVGGGPARQSADFSGMTHAQAGGTLAHLGARYQSDPGNRDNVLAYSAALRAAGHNDQALQIMENAALKFRGDTAIQAGYAKALAAAGKFDQALRVVDNNMRVERPDWVLINIKGAIFDQMGRHREARSLYQQGLSFSPNNPSILANFGLSYAMSNDLVAAEKYLSSAIRQRGATVKVRHNLALVIGLQGRFTEAKKMYSQDLSPADVEANMNYIRALLTQQNRWDVIKKAS